MVSLVSLWLPILLSAVLVFVVSSIIHMVFKYHQQDFRPLPDEEVARATLGKQNLAPGQYMIPCPGSMKAMSNPEWIRKFQEGPVAYLTVRPNGVPNIGKHLLQWFLFSLGLSVFVAYITSRTIPAGAPYLLVFRIAAAAAWMGYAGGLVWGGVWKGTPWSKVWIDVFDSLLYALVTAGAFAGFWPG